MHPAHTPPKHSHKLLLAFVIFIALAAAGFAYGGYRYKDLLQQNSLLGGSVRELEESLELSKENFLKLKEENKNLAEALQSEQEKNTMFFEQIRDLSGMVGTLQKLAGIDPELLRKYSKVYFLNENYVPAALATIDPIYTNDKSKTMQLHTSVYPFLANMLEAAKPDNVTILVRSAYRSYQTQVNIKNTYSVIYGAGTANKFSAEQGYSEHQLGTTVDITSPESPGITEKFATSAAYKWMQAHAHEYGFTLSYPPNNKYYIFEPWHWRFVGISLATRLHNENKFFYDLTQREINDYLVKTFDPTL